METKRHLAGSLVEIQDLSIRCTGRLPKGTGLQQSRKEEPATVQWLRNLPGIIREKIHGLILLKASGWTERDAMRYAMHPCNSGMQAM